MIFSESQQTYTFEDIQYFADQISKEYPDVICLQEVHVSDTQNQAEIIAKQC